MKSLKKYIFRWRKIAMEKKTTFAFNKKIYLVGTNNDGENVWLEAPSWDCNWYWGFGYLETYTNNANPARSRDIASHSHFSQFFNKRECGYDAFKHYFKDTVLSDDELWQLLDLMKTFYTLQETAEIMHRGHSNYTERVSVNIKDMDAYNHINKDLIPQITKAILDLLSPAND
jgi:hypothetical protein